MSAVRNLRRPRARKYRVPRGFAGPIAAPLQASITLGDKRTAPRVVVAVAIALLIHGAFVAMAFFTPAPQPKPVVREVPVVVAQRLPPPPPPPTPTPEPKPPPPKPQPHQARTPHPPAAAQAGKVIARAPDASQPVDMTSFDIVTGESAGFAGGFTASDGKSKTAVADASAQAHVPPAPPAPVGPDLSRSAEPQRADWSCAWPDDAQQTELRDARVAIVVHVDRDGEPQRVEVQSAPSPSFAEAATQCAMGESYRSALNHDGERIASVTHPFLVHFVR